MLLYFFISTIAAAQYAEYEVKAAFMEKFSRFIEWPVQSPVTDISQPFVLAVVGKDPFNHILDEIFNGHDMKNRKVIIKYFSNADQITECNLLFISGSEKKNLSSILRVIDKKPILSISDTDGFAEAGVHINMYVESNYIRYEINKEALEKAGLKISSLLLASAKIVKTDD